LALVKGWRHDSSECGSTDLHLEVGDEELRRRRAEWKPPALEMKAATSSFTSTMLMQANFGLIWISWWDAGAPRSQRIPLSLTEDMNRIDLPDAARSSLVVPRN